MSLMQSKSLSDTAAQRKGGSINTGDRRGWEGYCNLGTPTCVGRRLFDSFLDITVAFYFEVKEQSTKGRSRKLGLRKLGAQDAAGLGLNQHIGESELGS